MFRITLPLLLLGFASTALVAQDDSAAEAVPLWQYGISTFGGLEDEAASDDSGSEQVDSPKIDLSDAAKGGQNRADVQLAAYQDLGYPSSGGGPDLDLPAPGDGGVPLDGPLPALPTVPGVDGAPLDLGIGSAVVGSGTAIGEAIEAGETGEVAPLEEETVNWYQVPWRWVTRGWENHAELGLDGSTGNAKTLALQTGIELKRKTDFYTLGLDFDYRKASNLGLTTEENGRFNADYDHLFAEESRWSAFGKFGIEWDKFKAFDSRFNLNGGLGYFFVRSDAATFVTRFGAGASREIGAPDDAWKPEAVFGAEAEYQVNRYNKMKGKVDYFPVWTDFNDYRLVTDLAWEILLDDKDNLSLKLALTDRYDSTPQGAKPNDVYYSLLLLVKF